MAHDASAWLRGRGKMLSTFGERVAELLGRAYDGIYHMDYKVMDADFLNERWIECVIRDSDFATYDGSLMTRIVLLAHALNVQVRVKAHTHGYLKLQFCRVDRAGFFADRHPTIEESISRMIEYDVLPTPTETQP